MNEDSYDSLSKRDMINSFTSGNIKNNIFDSMHSKNKKNDWAFVKK